MQIFMVWPSLKPRSSLGAVLWEASCFASSPSCFTHLKKKNKSVAGIKHTQHHDIAYTKPKFDQEADSLKVVLQSHIEVKGVTAISEPQANKRMTSFCKQNTTLFEF